MESKRIMNELLRQGGTAVLPPDVACLKAVFLEFLTANLATPSLRNKVNDLAEVLACTREVFYRGASCSNVQAGFVRTGLEPPNFDAVVERVFNKGNFTAADVDRARAALPQAVAISKKNGMLTDGDLLDLGIWRTKSELVVEYKDQEMRPLRNQWVRRLLDRRVLDEREEEKRAAAAAQAAPTSLRRPTSRSWSRRRRGCSAPPSSRSTGSAPSRSALGVALCRNTGKWCPSSSHTWCGGANALCVCAGSALCVSIRRCCLIRM